MYKSARNGKRNLVVGIMSGTSQDDADYEAVMGDMSDGNHAAAKLREPSVFVLVVDREVPAAPAVWRKRFSDLQKQLPQAPHYFVLVTQSGAARGVFTAVTWLTDTPSGHTYKAMRSATEVDTWIAGELGEQFAVVSQLATEARYAGSQAAQNAV